MEAVELTWVQKAQGFGAIASGAGAILIPVAVAVTAYVLNKRQSRSHELVAARLDYYRKLVPGFNDLMCYMTFIGGWKRMNPLEVLDLKRTLDRDYHCAAPLFSEDVLDAHSQFMDCCFKTFNRWGRDAQLRTSPYRRRMIQADWDPEWDEHFAYSDDRAIPGSELETIRASYDRLVAAMVRDIDITRARPRYTTDQVSLNAHAPRRDGIAPAEA